MMYHADVTLLLSGSLLHVHLELLAGVLQTNSGFDGALEYLPILFHTSFYCGL